MSSLFTVRTYYIFLSPRVLWVRILRHTCVSNCIKTFTGESRKNRMSYRTTIIVMELHSPFLDSGFRRRRQKLGNALPHPRAWQFSFFPSDSYVFRKQRRAAIELVNTPFCVDKLSLPLSDLDSNSFGSETRASKFSNLFRMLLLSFWFAAFMGLEFARAALL